VLGLLLILYGRRAQPELAREYHFDREQKEQNTAGNAKGGVPMPKVSSTQ
jgi:hypothetical protein